MPNLVSSQQTGDFGEAYVKAVIETGWGCLFAPFQDRDRFGIDGTVVDVVNNIIKPLQYNVQIKTSSTFGSRNNRQFRAPVEQKHLDYWQQLNIPVVLVCVDAIPPTCAYWHFIRPGDKLPIYVSRQKIFGPGSRDAIVGVVRKALAKSPVVEVPGRMLDVPLHNGLRNTAKAYYKRLKMETWLNPTYGRVSFSWKGWRHITRKKRSTRKIALTMLLLPSLPEILKCPIQHVSSRELDPVYKGNQVVSRTLLVFEPMLKLTQRADARVRLVLERDILYRRDWATTDPRYNLLGQVCSFYSFSELPTK